MMTPDPINPDAKTLDELVLQLVEQGNGTAAGLERLTESVRLQTVASRAQTEATQGNTRRRRTGNRLLVAVLIALALLALYNNALVRAVQRQICPIVLLWGTDGSDAPPSTERSADIAREADALAERWNCTR